MSVARSSGTLVAESDGLTRKVANLSTRCGKAAVVPILLLLCMATATALYARRALSLELVEYGEGPILAAAERMKREPISPRWLEQPPFTLCAYGPAYYWLVVLASHWGPAEPSLVPGRLAILAAVLLTAAIIGIGVGRRTGSTDQGLLGATAYLLSPVAYYWIPSHRVDALAVLFSCAAYLVLGESSASIWVSAVLIAAGSLAKQTAALTAIPIFLHLLIVGRRRDAAWFAIAVGLLGGLCWWALDRYSGGYFWTTAIRGHQGAMSLQQSLFATAWLLAAPFSWACLLILGRFLRKQGPAETFRSLFFLALVVNFGLMAFMTAREGSTPNYFLETCALGSILIGLYALPLLREQRSRPGRIALGGLVVVIVAPCLFGLAYWPGAFTVMSAADAADARQQIADTPSGGLLIADGVWMPWVVGAGRVPAVNDPFTMRMLAEHGAIDLTPLVVALEARRIPLLVMDLSLAECRARDPRRWPGAMLDAMDRNYAPVVTRPGLFIYRPRSQPPSRENGSSP